MATFARTRGTTWERSGTFKSTGRGGYDYEYIQEQQKKNQSAYNTINEYYKRLENQEYLSNEDRANYKTAIDTFTNTGNYLRDVSKKTGTKYTAEEEKGWLDALSSLNRGYADIDKFYGQFKDDREYNFWKTNEQKKQQFESVRNASDYAENSQNKGWNLIVDRNVEYGDYKEKQGLRDKYMTDDEWGIYNYYLNTGNTKMAEEYLAWNDENLRLRAADKVYSKFNNTALELVFSASAGIDQFISGTRNVGKGVWGDEPVSTPTTQYVANKLGSDNTGVWKGANDLTQTVANQLPSILMNAAAPGVGRFTNSMSAGGNAYSEMINAGYSVNEARNYGIMIMASEAALSKVLGGISALGGGGGNGIFQKIAAKVLPGVNNAIARTAIQLGGNMLDEALEEGTQTALEPLFKHIATAGDEELNSIDWGEVAYSALLGGLSAGLLEGVPTVADSVSITQRAQKAYGAQSPEIVAQALELNPQDKLAKIAQTRLNEGKTVSGLALNDLVNNIEQGYIKQDTAKIKSAVEARLTELGETENVSALADALTKKAIGEKLSVKENNLIKNSKYGQRISNELNRNNIKSGQYSTAWAEGIGTKVLNADMYNLRESAPKQATSETKANNVEAVKSIANDNTQGYNEETVSAMIKGYDGTTTPSEYASAFKKAYEAGKENMPTSQLKEVIKSGLSQKVAFTAYELGKNSVLQNQTKSDIIKTEQSSEVTNENGEDIRLRNGGKRNGSKDTTGKVSTVEGSTGQTEGRAKAGRVAESDAARLVNEGQKVRVADLGIPGGSKTQTVVRLDKVDETDSMKKARAKAEARGLTVRFFAGDNLHIDLKNGEVAEVRAFIKGKYVYVRADHPYYTAEQLMDHELGHDKIANGEVDINKVRQRLEEIVGKDNIDAVAEAYIKAYEGTDYTIDEIWEECICDSLGDMNIFASDEVLSELMNLMMPNIKQAVAETTTPNKTRGSPEASLSNTRDGKNGWGKKFGTAQEALNDAIQSIDEKLWSAFNKELDSNTTNHPITNAINAVMQDVRQDKITPMQGAMLLSQTYKDGGVDALSKLYSHKTGNLFDNVLERAKQIGEGKASRQLHSKHDKALYASGVSFLHKNFPPENERLSEAHRLAVWWARNPNIEAGDQTLIFMNNTCYLVECFDDALNNYQVEDVVSTIDYKDILKEIKLYGRSGKIKSVQGSTDIIDMLNKSSGILKRGKSSLDSVETRYGIQDSTIQRMGEIPIDRREPTSSNGRGDSQSGGKNIQKYSREIDSVGNELTQEQAEYFKDSKVRDDEGNLLVVYHGSANKFTEFKHSKIGVHGTSLGKGFYFTEDVNLASSFQQDGGQLLQGYLDVKKPLVDGAKTISKNDVTKLIKAICESEAKYLVENDGSYDNVNDAIKDTFISNYVNTYNTPMANAYREMAEQVYRYNDSDADIIGELINGGAGAARVLGEVRKALGYDGVIFKHPDGVHEFVAFESNQFKNIDNKNPTTNPDIRFSRELDTAYLDTVKSGDMETAQKMVDEAAKKSGYTVKGYHGSHNSFTVFDEGKSGLYGGFESRIGFWFGTTKKGAENWANETWGSTPQVYDSWLKIEKPKVFTTNEVDSASVELLNQEIQSTENKYRDLYEQLRELGIFATWTVSDYIRNNGNSTIANSHNMDQETFLEAKQIAERLVSYNNELKKLRAKRGDLVFADSYEQFKTEIYKMAGMDAEDANVGGLGRKIPNDYEVIKKYKENLISQGYDSIIIRDTRFDADTIGEGKRTEQIVVFDPKQIKSADPVTYDDKGNVIPLSERFNPDNVDIRFSRELEFTDYLDENATEDVSHEVKPISNRELLVNSLESTAQHEVEIKKLQEYKSRIEMLNAEETKLAQLKSELKELTFGKGTKDQAKIKALREEIVKTENRINLHDKKLLQLESTQALKNVLEREKAKAYKRAAEKGREALHRNVEGRNKTAERHRIRDIAHELDTLLNKGTKKKNVKIGQQDVISKVLDVTDMLFATDDELILNGIKTEVTSAEQTAIDKYMRLYDEYHKYDDSVTEHKEERKAIRHEMDEIKKQFADVLERERQRISNLKASSAFDALIEEYKKIATSDKTYIRDTFDEDTLKMLERLKEDIGDTTVSNMTLEQLQTLRKALTMMKKMVQNANKLFANKDETIEALGRTAQSEIEAHGHKEKINVFEKGYAKYDWNNLKPIYLLERTGSSVLQKLGNAIFHGESVWAVDMEEAREFHNEQKLKYNFNNWNLDKIYTFTNATEQTYSLTLEQIMSIYAYSKRGKQALDHLKTDGFVYDETTEVKGKGGLIKYELNDKNAYKITEEVLVEIIGKLSTEQKAYVDAMQEYLSKVMGAKGNEVSRELYGIDLFGEENYFPIHSEGAYLERARQQANGETKIKNKGFTKETQKNARNAIVLSDFQKVWSEHVAEMSSYHAFTLPLEDFYRVYNYQTTSDEKVNKRGVIPALTNAYGKASTDAIDQLLKDLNGGARSDPRESGAADMLRKFKIGATMASLSVVVQQPSSIGRAQAMIDPKYFIGGKIGDTKRGELWGELKKYAPVAIIKEMGYFDVGMGRSSADWLTATEYDGGWERVKGFVADADYRSDVLSTFAAKADELTWVTIWNAVKRETASKNPTLNTSSEKFLKMAGERFEDVIRHTQVYDSTLSRSSNMRDKSLFMQMATSFMAEPTTAINMREMALRSGDKKRILRTTAAVYSAVLLNSLLVALPYAMRDDDEDETFLEKYVTAFSDSLISGINPVTSLPFVKDIWSIFQGYDVERSDMSLASDLIESFKKLVKAANNKEGYGEAIVSLLGDLSAFTGIPLNNIIRDAKSVINAGKTIMADKERDTTWNSIFDQLEEVLKSNTPVWGWLPSESKGEKLYEALVSGDTKYVARFRSTYKTDDEYNSAVRKSLRDNDPRMREAAQAYIDGNYSLYNALRDEISKEGIFDYKLITDALKAEINYLKRKAEEAEE